jgi:hypothetical protein
MSWHCLPVLVEDFSAGTCSDGEPCAPLKSTPSVGRFYSGGSWMAAYLASLSGTTCAPSTDGLGGDGLTSSAEGSHASRSAPPQGAETTQRTCGQKCTASLKTCDQTSSSPRMFNDYQFPEPLTTSTQWATVAAAYRWPRRTWVLTTYGDGIGFLATPTTAANWMSPSMKKWSCCRESARTLGRPRRWALEYLMGWPQGWTSLEPLGMARFLLWLLSHGHCSGGR